MQGSASRQPAMERTLTFRCYTRPSLSLFETTIPALDFPLHLPEGCRLPPFPLSLPGLERACVPVLAVALTCAIRARVLVGGKDGLPVCVLCRCWLGCQRTKEGFIPSAKQVAHSRLYVCPGAVGSQLVPCGLSEGSGPREADRTEAAGGAPGGVEGRRWPMALFRGPLPAPACAALRGPHRV